MQPHSTKGKRKKRGENTQKGGEKNIFNTLASEVTYFHAALFIFVACT